MEEASVTVQDEAVRKAMTLNSLRLAESAATATAVDWQWLTSATELAGAAGARLLPDPVPPGWA